METNKIYKEDCLIGLKNLPDNSIDCCVTSPPYFGLRDYGTGKWEGGNINCDHKQPPRGGHGIKSLIGSGERDIEIMSSSQYTSVCLKCGAKRIDEQIGLEETPELFVAKLIDVFTEVKRVLKDEGTLWLNLGDSYSGGGGASGHNENTKNLGAKTSNYGAVKSGGKTYGLKAKDLIGIPWMVAKALRGPFYTGRIKSEADRIWLAAMIDGEGCMFIHKRKAGSNAHSNYVNKKGEEKQYTRTMDTYSSCLEVANTHESIINKCIKITGVGSICCVDRETKLKKRNIPLFRWNVRNDQCKEIVREIYPYLVGKKHEARILLNSDSSGENAEKCHASLMLLHKGFKCDLDFCEPKSLYEPGFYLRQDIIWSKPNPMPESVTDRCTKSHEYIFLLSKSSKYYYDYEAIKTEIADTTIKRLMQDTRWQEGSTRVPGKTNGNMKAVGSVRKGYEHRGTGDKKLGSHSGNYAADGSIIGGGMANKKSVWTVTTKPFSEAHFATFPQDLIVDCIKAGCPEGGIILDPFMGAGTTALVAKKLNRNYIGFELNPEYIKIAEKRIFNEIGLFM